MTNATDTMDGSNRALTYQYDANGNRTRITHPDGKYWQLEYDGLNRAKRMLENTGQIGLMSYNVRGTVLKREWPYSSLNTVTTPTYDAAGRTTSLTHDLRATAGDVTYGYGYIPSGQLGFVSRSNDSYAWDGHVNLSRSYTVNGLNQYDSAGSASFCYDANGNLTADGGSVYLYDIENRLVEKRAQGAGNTDCDALSYAGALDAQLKYDPLGRLYKVEGYVSGTPQGPTRFLYDGDAMVAEYDGSGTMLRRYIHGTNADADDPLIWYEGNQVRASSRRFLLANHQGSIIAVTNYTGTLLTANAYDEYGINGSGNDGRFQYTGQAWLDDLGLYYYKARIYSPTLGRFLQTDPIGYEDQFNLYGYVGNDPVNGVDPSGMCSGNFKDDSAGKCGVGDKYDNSTLVSQNTVAANLSEGRVIDRDQLDSLSTKAASQIQQLTEGNNFETEYGYEILYNLEKKTLTTRVWKGVDGAVHMPLTNSDGSQSVLNESGHTHNGLVAHNGFALAISQAVGFAPSDRTIIAPGASPNDKAASAGNIRGRHYIYEQIYEGWRKISDWKRRRF